MDKVPFLMCIPDLEKRATVLNMLGKYQYKHYKTRLDIDLREVFPNDKPVHPIPDDLIPDIEKEMRSNSDIKARVK